ncbi:FadR/GntR family transcriptional regulator [Amycolatopsis alkalitolerans]|uniref:FadR family transcriptional regulator n=1 Tax=Amycolatopsis alkalitolerans TaxID=2547244 RepID=A0A5C4LVD3_9PSEU|nr:FCD domain-containing protein [Amycolatopsis alkalitolerans]TNC23229.1 FadR family transcriptional regulator [Amycolatopsis alkalitolerans]
MLDELGTAIVTGRLPAGTVLRLEELQEDYGASRTVAREVVRALEVMCLTSSKRRVGITVRDRCEWNHFDARLIGWQLDNENRAQALRTLMELRWAVEPTAARFAALRASPEDRGRLRALATRLQTTAKARDLTTFLEHDIAFHHVVLAASGNAMFCQLSDVVAQVLTGRTTHGLMPPEPQPAAVAMHVQVAMAVDAGDAEAAERAMRGIMEQARDEVAEQFE